MKLDISKTNISHILHECLQPLPWRLVLAQLKVELCMRVTVNIKIRGRPIDLSFVRIIKPMNNINQHIEVPIR